MAYAWSHVLVLEGGRFRMGEVPLHGFGLNVVACVSARCGPPRYRSAYTRLLLRHTSTAYTNAFGSSDQVCSLLPWGALF